jgi:hypothetical protein
MWSTSGETLHRLPGTAQTAEAPAASRPAVWRRAIRESAIAAAIVLAVAEAAALLVLAGGLVPGLSLGGALRDGGLLFFMFHHVGLDASTHALSLPHGMDVLLSLPHGAPVTATAAGAFLLGTTLVLVLTSRAGRVVAAMRGGGPRTRGLWGASVAVPYALLTFAFGFAVSGAVRLPETSPFLVHPSRVASLVWPLALAGVAGFAGGVRARAPGPFDSDWWESDLWSRRWRGAFAGAPAMLLTGMALALAGDVVLAVVVPGAGSTFLRTVFGQGPVAGLGLLALGLLALPNVALWTFVPAAGSCLQIGSGFGGPGDAYCFMSYAHTPTRPLPGTPDLSWGLPHLGGLPGGFLGFLAVPLLAALIGGAVAARRAPARTPREGAAVGALAGLVLIPLLVGALILAAITLRLTGDVGTLASGFYRYGPQPVDGVMLAVGWGMAGGGLGGYLDRRLLAGRRPPRDGPRPGVTS